MKKVALFTITIMLLSLCLFQASRDNAAWATAPMGWSDIELVSTVSTGVIGMGDMRTDSLGNVYFVWSDETPYAGSGIDSDIFYRARFRNGTWSATEVASEDDRASIFPSLGIDSDGNVHVVWVDGDPYRESAWVVYKMRQPNGTWVGLHTIGSAYYITLPCLDIDSLDNVHIAWDTMYNVWHTIKFQNGTWSTISLETGWRRQHPWLRIDHDNNIHVTWWTETEFGIYYLKILANGTRLGPTCIGSGGRESVLAIDSDGNPHVVWYNDWRVHPICDIWYRSFSDGSWNEIIEISSETSTRAYDPCVAVTPDGTVYVAWIDSENYEGSGEDLDIFYKKQVDGVWTTTKDLTPESDDNCYEPKLEADLSGHVHLSWVDLDDLAGSGTDPDVFYRSTYVHEVVEASIDIDPDTLNLRSKGKWITAYIEFPEGYNVADINVSSILLNDTIPVDLSAPTSIGDYDHDGIPDLMVKFDRAEVISYILDNIDIEERFTTVTLTITGYLYDGTPFQGSDTIKIVMSHTHMRR